MPRLFTKYQGNFIFQNRFLPIARQPSVTLLKYLRYAAQWWAALFSKNGAKPADIVLRDAAGQPEAQEIYQRGEEHRKGQLEAGRGL